MHRNFEWLESEFLEFIAEWQNKSQDIEYLSKSEKSRFCLSRQTIYGLRKQVNNVSYAVFSCFSIDV